MNATAFMLGARLIKIHRNGQQLKTGTARHHRVNANTACGVRFYSEIRAQLD